MQAEKHPEYATEDAQLAETNQAIERRLADYADPIVAYGADQRGAQAGLRAKYAQRASYQSAYDDPYRGRVDWLRKGETGAETFYVGLFALPDLGIFSWRDTVPGRIFYSGRASEAEDGVRLLKRLITVNNRCLLEITVGVTQLNEVEPTLFRRPTSGAPIQLRNSYTDEAIDPQRANYLASADALAVTAEPISGSDGLLISLLEGSHGRQLHEIVATIQAEQFRIISAPWEGIQIVQGVAGSGKSVIALHRVAYLLYQHRDQIDRRRVRFFGPNPIFLQYIARVLPDLGERAVKHSTFDGWMIERIGLQDSFEPEEEGLENLLQPNESTPRKVMRYRNARNKGSLAMGQLIDRYVDYLIQETLAGIEAMAFHFSLPSTRQGTRSVSMEVMLSAERARSIVEKVRLDRSGPVPLNQWKERAIEVLRQHVVTDAYGQVSGPHQDRAEFNRSVREQARKRIVEYLSAWSAENLMAAYRRLLRSPSLLRELGADLFSAWDLEMMHLDAPKQGTPFRFSDLGALLYFKARLDGVAADEQFDLVVVDEAQDMTPLQFSALRLWSRNGAFTIVGDIAQGIYSDLGLQSWEDLGAVFAKEQITRHELRQSYRSTYQIIDYSNRIYPRTDAVNLGEAIPLARSGEIVIEEVFYNETDRVQRVAAYVRNWLGKGHQTIAIITKTSATCRVLAQQLQGEGLTDFAVILDREQNAFQTITLLPVYLSKGLEFDCVIVADADALTYRANRLDARLLYVALTRAVHVLVVGWIGERTPLLEPSDHTLSPEDSLDNHLVAELVTIDTFAELVQPPVEPDLLVERLAATSRLSLMADGMFDRHLLAVLAEQWPQTARPDEEGVAELPEVLRQHISTTLSPLRTDESSAIQDALGFLHLIAGLLRNTLATVRISLSEDTLEPLTDHACALLLFWREVTLGNTPYAAGAYTTRRRTLEHVPSNMRTSMVRHLQVLCEYGIVEISGSPSQERIRVAYEWIVPLASLALASRLGRCPARYAAMSSRRSRRSDVQ